MRNAAVAVERRGRRRSMRGAGLTEFALVGPGVMLLLLGVVVGGIVITNQLQLSSAARDGARAAAVCGGPSRYSLPVTPTLPDGHSPCDSRYLISYVNGRMSAVPGGVTTSICVYVGSQDGSDLGTTCLASDPVDPNILDHCNKGTVVQIDISYPQPLYIPLVGNVFGDHGGMVRTLHASAQAVCEQ